MKKIDKVRHLGKILGINPQKAVNTMKCILYVIVAKFVIDIVGC